MSEIKPKLTYRDETLEVIKTFPSTLMPPRLKQTQELCEGLSTQPGLQAELSESEIILRANIPEVLATRIKGPNVGKNISQLLKTIQFFATYERRNYQNIDDVFSLRVISPAGSVSTQLQRWLNSNEIDEQSAKETIIAMALPFGKQEVVDALKKFSFRSTDTDTHIGTGDEGHFSISSKRISSGLTISKFGHDGILHGKVAWNFLDLNSNGSLLGVDVERLEHEPAISEARVNNLYNMQGYDIDGDTQRLSLILGVAVIATNAARYSGIEDIFGEIDWKKKLPSNREVHSLRSL